MYSIGMNCSSASMLRICWRPCCLLAVGHCACSKEDQRTHFGTLHRVLLQLFVHFYWWFAVRFFMYSNFTSENCLPLWNYRSFANMVELLPSLNFWDSRRIMNPSKISHSSKTWYNEMKWIGLVRFVWLGLTCTATLSTWTSILRMLNTFFQLPPHLCKRMSEKGNCLIYWNGFKNDIVIILIECSLNLQFQTTMIIASAHSMGPNSKRNARKTMLLYILIREMLVYLFYTLRFSFS